MFAKIKSLVEYVRDLDTGKVYPDGHDEIGNNIIGEIIIAMRNDLIGRKTKLTMQDFIFWDVREK